LVLSKPTNKLRNPLAAAFSKSHGSFVFGMDGDDADVFERTVE